MKSPQEHLDDDKRWREATVSRGVASDVKGNHSRVRNVRVDQSTLPQCKDVTWNELVDRGAVRRQGYELIVTTGGEPAAPGYADLREARDGRWSLRSQGW